MPISIFYRPSSLLYMDASDRCSGGCRDRRGCFVRIEHLSIQPAELMQGAEYFDAESSVDSAGLHGREPGCGDEPLNRTGSLVVIGRVEQHGTRRAVGLRGQRLGA